MFRTHKGIIITVCMKFVQSIKLTTDVRITVGTCEHMNQLSGSLLYYKQSVTRISRYIILYKYTPICKYCWLIWQEPPHDLSISYNDGPGLTFYNALVPAMLSAPVNFLVLSSCRIGK